MVGRKGVLPLQPEIRILDQCPFSHGNQAPPMQPNKVPEEQRQQHKPPTAASVIAILRVCLPSLEESSRLEAAGDHACARAVLMGAFQSLLGTFGAIQSEVSVSRENISPRPSDVPGSLSINWSCLLLSKAVGCSWTLADYDAVVAKVASLLVLLKHLHTPAQLLASPSLNVLVKQLVLMRGISLHQRGECDCAMHDWEFLRAAATPDERVLFHSVLATRKVLGCQMVWGLLMTGIHRMHHGIHHHHRVAAWRLQQCNLLQPRTVHAVLPHHCRTAAAWHCQTQRHPINIDQPSGQDHRDNPIYEAVANVVYSFGVNQVSLWLDHLHMTASCSLRGAGMDAMLLMVYSFRAFYSPGCVSWYFCFSTHNPWCSSTHNPSYNPIVVGTTKRGDTCIPLAIHCFNHVLSPSLRTLACSIPGGGRYAHHNHDHTLFGGSHVVIWWCMCTGVWATE